MARPRRIGHPNPVDLIQDELNQLVREKEYLREKQRERSLTAWELLHQARLLDDLHFRLRAITRMFEKPDRPMDPKKNT